MVWTFYEQLFLIGESNISNHCVSYLLESLCKQKLQLLWHGDLHQQGLCQLHALLRQVHIEYEEFNQLIILGLRKREVSYLLGPVHCKSKSTSSISCSIKWVRHRIRVLIVLGLLKPGWSLNVVFDQFCSIGIVIPADFQLHPLSHQFKGCSHLNFQVKGGLQELLHILYLVVKCNGQ